MLEVGKTVVDFGVRDYMNPKYFFVTDLSEWKQAASKPSIIEITPPGSRKFVTHYFEKGQENQFNSIKLQLNCDLDCDTECIELPDGIYQITVKGSPDSNFMCKDYLRTVNMELELDAAYLSEDGSPKLKQKVCDIEMLLKAAKANVRSDNFGKAQELFEMAEIEVEKLKDCQDCV